MNKTANMVMADLGPCRGSELLSEDLQGPRLKKFSLTRYPGDPLLRCDPGGRNRHFEIPAAREIPDSGSHVSIARLRIL